MHRHSQILSLAGWRAAAAPPSLAAETPRAATRVKAALGTPTASPAAAVPRMGQNPRLDAPRRTRCRMSCSDLSWPRLAPTEPAEDFWQLLIPSDFQRYLVYPQMFSPSVQLLNLDGQSYQEHSFSRVLKLKTFCPGH